MGFWIYMFIMDLLIPIIMILFGRAFLKKAPKEINYVFGYRTSRSMKNRDTWEFAHRYCGKIWLICGLALIPIVAGIMLCFIGADTKTVGYVGAALLVFPLLLIILSVILTERALKNTFDKSGNPFLENTTIGTILSVKKQWWLKINTKPIRKHALDGATFPHIVTVKYTVDGNEIVKKKWLKSFVTPPSVNEQVAVIYRTDKPTKFRLEL